MTYNEYHEWLFLLGLIALFLLSPALIGLGRSLLRLNPNWRDELLPSMETLKINGVELDRLLKGQDVN